MTTNAVSSKHKQEAASRDMLSQQYGQVWDEAELQQEFEVVVACSAAYTVRRKSDNVAGRISCQDTPRLYFDFLPQ